MSFQGWTETLAVLPTAGPVLNTFTTAKSAFGTTTDAARTAQWVIPAGYFNGSNIGKTLRVTAKGRKSTFTSGTFTWSLQLLSPAITLWTTAAITPQFSKTDLTWEMEVEMVLRAAGPGTLANMMCIGRLTSELLGAPAAGIAYTILVPTTAPAVSAGFDSTAAQTLDFFVAESVSNAANQVQVHTYKVESLN